MPVAIVGRRVVTPSGVRPAAVLVDPDRGRIVDVISPDSAPTDARLHDVGDHVVMPGIVDTHVHINEPGRTDWEGFTTATRSAAAGGVTTLVDMPLNCIPVTTSADALRVKLDACRGQLWVDVGFWGGVVPGNADALEGLARAGALGAKAFMIDSGIDEFEWCREPDLRAGMKALAAAGLPLLAHAELDLGADVVESDPRKYRGYLQSRPRAWEDEAIAMLIRLCRETGCAVHVVHLSSSDSIPQIRAAKAEGLPITVETCAHYLCLAAEHVPDGRTEFKCAPPIREESNRRALWAALHEGVIDFVVTDHSPCTPGLKLPEEGDFHRAWGGIASLQLGLVSVWTELQRQSTDTTSDAQRLVSITRWMSEAPAKFAGLSQRKGRIEPGFDADLVVWDPNERARVDASALEHRHKISPYDGRELRGVVHQTWLRGVPVFDGAVTADPRGVPLLTRDRPVSMYRPDEPPRKAPT